MKKLFTNLYFLIFLALACVGLIVYLIIRKNKKEAQAEITIAKVNEAISGETGVTTSQDSDSILLNVVPDINYSAQAIKDAQKLKDAISWINDDEQAVFDTLTGKTKSQLKAIEQALKQIGFKGFEDYFNQIFDLRDTTLFGLDMPCLGLDCDNYKKALTIIKSAK